MTTQNENSDVNVTVVEQSPAPEPPVTSGDAEGATPPQEAQAAETQVVEGQLEQEAVRPFADFIEEFRQTEVQFGSLLQDAQAEPFPSSLPGKEQGGSQFANGWESTRLDGMPFAGESVDPAATQFVEGTGVVVEAIPEPSVPAEPLPTTQEQQLSTSDTKAEAAAERPVSPLLRPASRNRTPRHGHARQRGEAAPQKENVVPAQPSAAPVLPPVEDTVQAVTAPMEPAAAETTSIEEAPRPARRYRFDRPMPAASSVPAAPIQVRTEESKDSHIPSQALTHADNGQVDVQPAQQPQQSASAGQLTEQLAPKQISAHEPVATTGVEVAKGTSSKNDRRHHGQERHGEKMQTAVPAPAESGAEVTAPVAENSEPGATEVAPEDLPPLEYSELQAASSRRRRRRRPGSSGPAMAAPNINTPAAAKPAVPDVPSGIPTPAAPSPVNGQRNLTVPGTPTPSAGQYSIVSGYTVSQMNHGNEGAGPFMGPEPSPARGGSLSRNVRPIRNEAQRMPVSPGRPHEGGASAASISHLANVVAQAIQGQTDRMVAELRRANQIPTSISVALPQLPSTERVGVFVDVANLLYSARTLRMTVDFGKLLDFLRGNRRLVRAHAYCPTSPQPGDEQMFLQAVKGLGYRITTKDYKTFSSGAKKADLDLDLCMDVVRLVEGKAVDCIVLVSGDSDFMPMLDYCSDHGVRVEVAAFDESMSATLRQSCDLFINLSMLDEIRA
ncbi:MAG TPA: NYN domain-containing protein [Ktedonobacteraceae bacterium]|nr:NYN domain-containing protein [Ktedonobacteraceae bacterium]